MMVKLAVLGSQKGVIMTYEYLICAAAGFAIGGPMGAAIGILVMFALHLWASR